MKFSSDKMNDVEDYETCHYDIVRGYVYVGGDDRYDVFSMNNNDILKGLSDYKKRAKNIVES